MSGQTTVQVNLSDDFDPLNEDLRADLRTVCGVDGEDHKWRIEVEVDIDHDSGALFTLRSNRSDSGGYRRPIGSFYVTKQELEIVLANMEAMSDGD
jgi:hypothetical protein